MNSVLLCLVVAITDGDTLKVHCRDQPQLVIRISAIDAPEKRQAWGQRSKQSLSTLCFQQQATLKVIAKDRFGRSVADVLCQGEDAGEHQVRTGMAWVFDRYAKGHGHLYPLQDAARGAGRGLWGDGSQVPPWEWRSLHRQ